MKISSSLLYLLFGSRIIQSVGVYNLFGPSSCGTNFFFNFERNFGVRLVISLQVEDLDIISGRGFDLASSIRE